VGNSPSLNRTLGWRPPEDPSNQPFYESMGYHLCEIKQDAFGKGGMWESTGHEEKEEQEAAALRMACCSTKTAFP